MLGPLLLPGYILALDMAFTPELRAPQTVNSSYPLYMLMHWLDLLLPADWIQKLLLFTILLLAGWGMHRLVAGLEKPRLPSAALYMAGLLYMVNPFTYDRLMTGQFAVLFGYALLPWCLAALLALVAKPGRRSALLAATWAVALGIVSIHSLGPLLVIGGLALAVHARRKRVLAYVAMAAGIWLVASSYWLVPALLGNSPTAQTVSSFAASDRAAFATIGDGVVEQLGNVLALQGFWAEDRGLFKLPQQVVPGWPLLMVGLLALVAIGGVALWRRQRGLLVIFSGCIAIGAVLASGIGGGWLAQHIPFYAGYREPQKFVMLVALGYAVLVAYGLQAVLRRSKVVGLVLLALPLLLTPTMLWGTNGQLRSVDYPAGWYAANQRLNSDSSDFQTLFLPWHLYIEADFADGRTIATPAPNFFDKPVIVSDDPGLSGVALSRSTPAKRQINQLLDTAPRSDRQLGEALAKLDVKYILVAETSDYTRYGYLARQSNLTLVGDYEGMKLYRNQAYPVQ